MREVTGLDLMGALLAHCYRTFAPTGPPASTAVTGWLFGPPVPLSVVARILPMQAAGR